MKKVQKTLSISILTVLCTSFALAKAPETSSSEITVMSYNIRMGTADDGTNSWSLRFPATAMMIEDQHPDIFGVQEAFDFQVRFITDNLVEYKAVGVGREDGKSKGEHMAIFYNKKKLSLMKWGTFWLSDTPEKPSKGWDGACFRSATWALMKCKKTGRKFYFVNTHLDHIGKEARKNGLALVIARINAMNKDGLPVVLTGDFNMKPDDNALTDVNSFMKSARAHAISTDQHASYNGWGKSSSVIDYIYYRGFSYCKSFTTVVKPYDNRKFVSDHYPIKAVLVF